MFGISRNPIFLGVIIVFIGLFLIIPNVVTVVILVSGVIVIQVYKLVGRRVFESTW